MKGKRVFLIGMMGSGKSFVSRILAERLHLMRIDLDDEIVKREGRPINDIFAKEGEAYFRRVEKKVLRDTAEQENTVFATGGGIILDAANIECMKKYGEVFYLKASVDELAEHLALADDRPLLKEGDLIAKLRQLLNERRHLYERADYIIETDGLSLDEIAEAVVKKMDGEV